MGGPYFENNAFTRNIFQIILRWKFGKPVSRHHSLNRGEIINSRRRSYFIHRHLVENLPEGRRYKLHPTFALAAR